MSNTVLKTAITSKCLQVKKHTLVYAAEMNSRNYFDKKNKKLLSTHSLGNGEIKSLITTQPTAATLLMLTQLQQHLNKTQERERRNHCVLSTTVVCPHFVCFLLVFCIDAF